ncbi:MAG: hypothetical protein AAB719_01950 [Patescibacteria group bacterium]
MEPKFQSSFIPKGPIGPSANTQVAREGGKSRSILSYVSMIVFVLSVLLAGGVFGYKYYLKYSIENMGTALEEARANLEPETISELTRLNSRLVSTRDLVLTHRAITPLFEFIEMSTPKTVRFNTFSFTATDAGVELSMGGEARGYSALALAADIFNKSEAFKNPVFSNLSLNLKGDVVFSFKATVDPSLVLYSRQTEPVPDAEINTESNLELQ